ncbi:MAG: Uncharacterized protein G01um101416_1221 [Microgenomates group bacterium Gr01-1014_16]|nr:MAG: Uncharacterized protein G01um101416_1221 [Microgenomates group bacterium Gr01-1014_16]
MTPNDLGDFSQVSENCQKISIDELVRLANRQLKQNWIKHRIELAGVGVGLVTSRTRFGGERLWFACPVCGKRVGKLYQNQSRILGCRSCLGIRYAKSRYKGMVEAPL